MMKRFVGLACAIAFVSASTSATALPLSVGDALYLGAVEPAPLIPLAPLDLERFLVDRLLHVNPGMVARIPSPVPPAATYTLRRQGSSLVGPFAPVGDVSMALQCIPPFSPACETGFPLQASGFPFDHFDYGVADYGTVAHVWLLAGLSGVTVQPQRSFAGSGLIRWRAFGGPVRLPDGDATLGLLGMALLGLWLIQHMPPLAHPRSVTRVRRE